MLAGCGSGGGAVVVAARGSASSDEVDTEPGLFETGIFDVQIPQRVRQHDVAPVGPHAQSKLIRRAVEIEIALLGKRKWDNQIVPILPVAFNLVRVASRHHL